MLWAAGQVRGGGGKEVVGGVGGGGEGLEAGLGGEGGRREARSGWGGDEPGRGARVDGAGEV